MMHASLVGSTHTQKITTPVLHCFNPSSYSRGINACGLLGPIIGISPGTYRSPAINSNHSVYDFHSNGPLLSTVYGIYLSLRSTLRVSVASTHNKAAEEGQHPKDVLCPHLLPEPQEYMRGVDRGDQMKTYYNSAGRSGQQIRQLPDQAFCWYLVVVITSKCSHIFIYFFFWSCSYYFDNYSLCYRASISFISRFTENPHQPRRMISQRCFLVRSLTCHQVFNPIWFDT